jgi:uncharacterized protein DUF6378
MMKKSESKAKTTRGKVLEEALNLTEGDRNRTYGDPSHNLTCYAYLVDSYLFGRKANETELNAVDGAMLMALAKISRIAVNQTHKDNYVDLAAYAAIGFEVSGV